MPRTLDGIRRMIASAPWAMLPEYIDAMIDLVELRANGHLSDAEIAARIAAADHPLTAAAGKSGSGRAVGAVAVLPLYGVIAQKASMVSNVSGPSGTSTEGFGQAFDAAMGNDDISAIVIDINSPGGAIDGVDELTTKIFRARGTKRIGAVANTTAASAAYYIGSAADDFAATPSGSVGSIGVYTVHNDLSGAMAAEGVKQTLISAGKYKAEAHPSQPLSDEAHAALQERVDEAYSMFVNAVARNRGVTVSDVRNGYGQGRLLGAKKALEVGLVDRIATLDEMIARVANTRTKPPEGRVAMHANIERERLALLEHVQ
jgi:signal peptide peptidase SppA